MKGLGGFEVDMAALSCNRAAGQAEPLTHSTSSPTAGRIRPQRMEAYHMAATAFA